MSDLVFVLELVYFRTIRLCACDKPVGDVAVKLAVGILGADLLTSYGAVQPKRTNV